MSNKNRLLKANISATTTKLTIAYNIIIIL